MVNRKSSRVAFTFAAISAVVITTIVLYSLVAGFTAFQALTLLGGSLLVTWAILFSFFEVRRIAQRSKSITGEVSDIDPDAPRKVVVGPPTSEATPHHEFWPESPGSDQGQLTSRLSGTPSPGELFRRKKQAS
jgi:hypothetical protein